MKALRARLAGADGATRGALPAGEFLHPVPLVALLLLVANDQVLKGSGWAPPWLTGKLSDFAGALVFPLLLTAAGNSLAWGLARATGWRLDFSLRRWKLALALAVTAAIFVLLELSAAGAALVVAGLHGLGFASARTVADPWDLLALVMLWPAWRLGLAEVRRVPLGRVEVILRGRRPASGQLRDVRSLANRKGHVDELARALEAQRAAPTLATATAVDATLASLRVH